MKLDDPYRDERVRVPASCVLLKVITSHPQDYVLVNEADGTRWRGTAEGGWVADDAPPRSGQ